MWNQVLIFIVVTKVYYIKSNNKLAVNVVLIIFNNQEVLNIFDLFNNYRFV